MGIGFIGRTMNRVWVELGWVGGWELGANISQRAKQAPG